MHGAGLNMCLSLDTAICHNPIIHRFTGDRKKSDIINRPTLKHIMFLRKYEEKHFFFFTLTQSVFVIQLPRTRESQSDEL